jgi:hypothetical protein
MAERDRVGAKTPSGRLTHLTRGFHRMLERDGLSQDQWQRQKKAQCTSTGTRRASAHINSYPIVPDALATSSIFT